MWRGIQERVHEVYQTQSGFPIAASGGFSENKTCIRFTCSVSRHSNRKIMHPRVAFAQWYLGKCATNPLFPDEVLFSDEASFTREGIFNTQIDHILAVENPHAIRRRAAQIRFSVNQVLPQLLRDEQISASTQQTMWFQHDGVPAHFSGDVRNYLDVTFGQQWIGRGGPVRWPARSPDLSCLDFYFWGHMKSLVYDTPVDNAEELVARIAVAAGEIRNSPEYSRMFGCPCVGDVRRVL
ncbi:uncharacterized protein TNCV_5055871 [Trichonephila clavipes]|nr:uncharacterized protein TNCV_5055871 [Trichonephila clavipes]